MKYKQEVIMAELNASSLRKANVDDCLRVLKRFLMAEKNGAPDLEAKRVNAEHYLKHLEKILTKLQKDTYKIIKRRPKRFKLGKRFRKNLGIRE
jgi:hypothetical protein